MQLFVRVPFGEQPTVALDVEAHQTVHDVKAQLASKFQCSEDSSILLSSGFQGLADDVLVEEIESEFLVASIALCGGGKDKKRKKKNYTKPKRIPHKKKNIKLAILNYYNVSDNGESATLLKINCPKPECQAYAALMANHKNRNSCGRCGSTYVRKDA